MDLQQLQRSGVLEISRLGEHLEHRGAQPPPGAFVPIGHVGIADAAPFEGSLKVGESRRVAELLLKGVDDTAWKRAIVDDNILQARNPESAKRLARLIRARLEPMGPELWRLVCDGQGPVATHAVFAAAVKHSALLGDFLGMVVAEQYRIFTKALSNKLFDDYLERRP